MCRSFALIAGQSADSQRPNDRHIVEIDKDLNNQRLLGTCIRTIAAYVTFFEE